MNAHLNSKLDALRVQLEANGTDLSTQLNTKLEVAKEALREIVRGCEYRLRKGHDEGDASTLRLAKDALKRLA